MTIGSINPNSIKPNYNPVEPIIAPINVIRPSVSENVNNVSIQPIVITKNVTN